MSIGERITADLLQQQYANQPPGPTRGWEAGQLPRCLWSLMASDLMRGRGRAETRPSLLGVESDHATQVREAYKGWVCLGGRHAEE